MLADAARQTPRLSNVCFQNVRSESALSARAAQLRHTASRGNKLAGESGSGKAPLSVRRHHDGGGMRCCSTGFDDEWRASEIAIGCDGVRALYSAQTGILEGLADVRYGSMLLKKSVTDSERAIFY